MYSSALRSGSDPVVSPPWNNSGLPVPVAHAPGGRPEVCLHVPPCPPSQAQGRLAARVIASHPEQGWSLLCNGMVVFDDTGALLPDGSILEPGQA
jgi:Family of unknown function (DUF5999)